MSAAVAAARMGRQVVLVNNRPVLGGNSSSEVRVWVCGATAHGNQRWARETGIVGEMYVENQYRNPEGNPVYWDDVVLDTVRREENLRLFLNTDVRDVVASGPDDARRIESVTGWTMGSEILTTFTAPVFLDCTGDGLLVGHLAGARYRLGKEGREEFGEDWAPEEPVREFLGSTPPFYTRDLGFPVKYVAPETAKDIATTPIPMNRVIRSGDSGAHYWWIEWGGELDVPTTTSASATSCARSSRDLGPHQELGRVRRRQPHARVDRQRAREARVPPLRGRLHAAPGRHRRADRLRGRRRVRRVVHRPTSRAGHVRRGVGAIQRFSDGVFEIPFRSLYSVNVENMLMAGRDMSATHIAFGASRVMATCGAMGQAAGTAAALCVEHGTTPRGLYADYLADLRQTLLRWDAPVVGVANEDPHDLARSARVTASSTTTSIAADHAFAPHDGGADVRPHDLVDDLGIVVPVHPALETVELLVSARRNTTLGVEVWSTGKPQNVVPVRLEAKTDVELTAGDEPAWVTARVPFTPDVPQNAIVVLRANPDVTVRTTTPLPPGVLTLVHRTDNADQNVEVSQDELLVQWPTKPLRGRSVVFRAGPETQALAPERATSGYNRPFGGPQLWASAPMSPGRDEWLRLDWEAPVLAREVRVVLDDDVDLELNTLHHHRSPHETLPELVKDYRVEVLPAGAADDSWVAVVDETDNRWRHRVHPLPADVGPLRAVRLVVSSTNGAPQARIVALRVQA